MKPSRKGSAQPSSIPSPRSTSSIWALPIYMRIASKKPKWNSRKHWKSIRHLLTRIGCTASCFRSAVISKAHVLSTRPHTCERMTQKRQIIHDSEALACHVRSEAKANAKGRCAPNTIVKIDNFFAELKRRNVYKVAVE